MRSRVLTLSLAAGLLVAMAAFPQASPVGKITGIAQDDSGAGVPGVTVTAESPNLQGTRTTLTGTNGAYVFNALPPGDYTLSFELDGFDTQTERRKVAAAQVHTLNVNMSLATVAEEILVTAETGTISETSTGATTFQQEMVEKLPIARTLASSVFLAPGTNATGPGGNISISGGQSYENLYLINGIIVNENLRGQASTLFIEDAIQEVTTATLGIGAQYGRFTGGVVNAITKAGGNQITGSLRDSFTNEDWAATSPFGEEKLDKVNEVYEGTLGGYFIRDRVWFFSAGRFFDIQSTGTTTTFAESYDQVQEETRMEGKLTFKLTPSHSLLVAAVDIEDDRAGNAQLGGVSDTRALNNSAGFPEESFVANYNGIFGDNFFIEAQYSERALAFVGLGGLEPDRVLGSPIIPFDVGRNGHFYNPAFDGREDSVRDSNETGLRGSYFLTTGSAGSHDLVFGADTYSDKIRGNNKQSSTDYDIWSSTAVRASSGEIVPVFRPFDGIVIYRPIFQNSLGSDLESNSFYINDSWQLNNHWSFQIGLRYDENDGIDAGGTTIADDSKISPRLAASYDIKGDGDWVIHASGGKYVSKIVNGTNLANRGTAAGSPSFFAWLYTGPAINADVIDTTAEDALRIVFDWFDSTGGLGRAPNFGSNIAGASTLIGDSLQSPDVTEFAVGFSKRLGARGSLRADYVNREFGDLFVARRDLVTGQGVDANGAPFDFGLVINDDAVQERKYDALQTLFTYRVMNRLSLGGNWTWSHARGNLNGEGEATGPVSGTILEYPEYKAFASHNPKRDLGVDQRHKVRLWGIWTAFAGERQNLSLALLQNFFNGQNYSAIGAVDTRPFVPNLNYVNPPANVGYFFDTNGYSTDDISRTDFSVNYSFKWQAFGRELEVGIQPEILNVFNEDGVLGVNATDVLDATTDPGDFAPFNPFTDTPVQGTNWGLGPRFGLPQEQADYQIPRTFRFSVLFRF